MENNQKPGIGAGIITVSIIHFVFSGIGLLIMLAAAAFQDTINSTLEASGQTARLTSGQILLSIVFALILILSVILILLKKKIGVFIYFAFAILSPIYSIITSGFSFLIFLDFILPILMAVFISQKKELYGFGNGTGNSMYQ
ncbi:MAG: hypothetical protein Q8930_11230 [Bacillota bacterium]|nr:hypothetical protein [Bacillota bacterium]